MTKTYDQQFLVGENLSQLVEAVLEMPHYSAPNSKITFTKEFQRVDEVRIIFTRSDEEGNAVLKLNIHSDTPENRALTTRLIQDRLWSHSNKHYLPEYQEFKAIDNSLSWDNTHDKVQQFLNTVCDWLPNVIKIERTLNSKGNWCLRIKWTIPGTKISRSSYFKYVDILNDQGNKYLMERMIGFAQLGWTVYPSSTQFATGGITTGLLPKFGINTMPQFGSPFVDNMPKVDNTLRPVADNTITTGQIDAIEINSKDIQATSVPIGNIDLTKIAKKPPIDLKDFITTEVARQLAESKAKEDETKVTAKPSFEANLRYALSKEEIGKAADRIIARSFGANDVQ